MNSTMYKFSKSIFRQWNSEYITRCAAKALKIHLGKYTSVFQVTMCAITAVCIDISAEDEITDDSVQICSDSIER